MKLVLHAILLISLSVCFMNCTDISECPELEGWWTSESNDIRIRFKSDSLYLLDSRYSIYSYEVTYYNDTYKIIDDNLIYLNDSDYGRQILGCFTKDLNQLNIHFHNFPSDSIVQFKPVNIKLRAKLVKAQFSHLGFYSDKRACFDIQIDSTGLLIYNGKYNCRFSGFHKGKSLHLYNLIECTFIDPGLSTHLSNLNKHEESFPGYSHLSLFWEDTTETFQLTTFDCIVPLEIQPLYSELKGVYYFNQLIPIDSSMCFQSNCQ